VAKEASENPAYGGGLFFQVSISTTAKKKKGLNSPPL